jgi:hypothetical protein
MAKRFKLVKPGTNEDVLGGAVGADNVYIRTYGAIHEGHKHPDELNIGEVTLKTFALSGQKPTAYEIVRVEDAADFEPTPWQTRNGCGGEERHPGMPSAIDSLDAVAQAFACISERAEALIASGRPDEPPSDPADPVKTVWEWAKHTALDIRACAWQPWARPTALDFARKLDELAERLLLRNAK